MAVSLLSLGSRALMAAQGTLNTVSHNIANANTPGYSRQEAMLSTAGAQFTGAGFFGHGVQLDTVRRQYDQFLTNAVQSSTAQSSADRARADGLKSLDAVFSDSALGIGASLDAFFAAAGDLANRPADTSARQVFVARARQLAERVASVGSQIRELAQAADGRLALDAAQVNTRLDEIHKLNDQIAQLRGTGQAPNDLLDQRDAALQALNGLLAVKAVPQDDGTLALFTVSGQALLVGNQQSRLQAVPDPADPQLHALRLTVGNTTQLLDAPALGGGSLAGLLKLRDEDLPAALNQVGRIGIAVASAFNAQQKLGIDANGVPGADLFTIPGPQSRPHAANTSNASVEARIADASALQPSDYEVRFDGSNYTIVRLADGSTSDPTPLPTTMDGIEFSSMDTPAAGDRWRVQPFAAAATGLAARPLTPRDVATAFAATVAPQEGNTGGASVTGFAVVRAGAENKLAATITFLGSPPDTVQIASGSVTQSFAYVPGQPLPPTGDFNGWRITLDGNPAPGDTFKVEPTTSPASDNRNALALGQLARQGLLDGATLNQAYASLLGDVGSRVQSGEAAADISQQLANEAVARQQNVSGVNLDEEAANLLRFQQAYQACARIIQTSQSLFDTLLSATGR